jgi:hypothetical protein
MGLTFGGIRRHKSGIGDRSLEGRRKRESNEIRYT